MYCAPGNGGIAADAEIVDIQPTGDGIDALVDFAKTEGIDLTVIGPEAPLVEGAADRFEAAGLRVFGPRQDGAQLEGSKVFTKEFLSRHGVPTAPFRVFDDAKTAREYLAGVDLPVVLKADGLAAGKGVIIASDAAAALHAVDAILVERRFGDAGARLIVEDCLEGSEISIFLLLDGENYLLLETAQDYKPAYDGDEGPNTGGMGCYSPYYARTDPVIEDVVQRVVEPTVSGLRADGIRYCGVLYIGVMLTREGPQVLEFNCRFGDPETQVVLPRLQSDLVEAFERCVDGTLAGYEAHWNPSHAVCVVLASRGYPGSYPSGVAISGLDAAATTGAMVYHAGTRREGEQIVTAGGRVLGVTALDESRETARGAAYNALEKIHFDGAQFRTDIAAGAR